MKAMILNEYGEGELKPLVDEKQFSLTEAGKAYDHLVSGQAIGKVVVEI